MMAAMGAISSRRRTLRTRRGVTASVCALACAAALSVLAGCTDSADEPPDSGTDDAPLEIELVSQAGTTGREERDELQRQVGDVLTSYVVAAFLGDYPRDDFVGALSSFTSRAAEQAAGDLELLTARRYGDADDVRAERLVARVSAFAADGTSAGASARIQFRFSVREGEETSSFRVQGRLALVPEGEDWRIFGYRVSRDDASQDLGGEG